MWTTLLTLGLVAHRGLQSNEESAECLQASLLMIAQCPDITFNEDFDPAKSVISSICADEQCATAFKAVNEACLALTPASSAALATMCTGTCGTAYADDCNTRCDACLYEAFSGDESDPPACVNECWTCTPFFHCTPDEPCFPGDAIVETMDDGPKRVRDLEADDAILARTLEGILTYDFVSPLSITSHDIVPQTLLRINATGGASIVVTTQHRLATGKTCCANLTEAGHIKVGDAIHDNDGLRFVTSIEPHVASSQGLYSPVLSNGGLPIVDGLVTSPGSMSEMMALQLVGNVLHYHNAVVSLASFFLQHSHPILLNMTEKKW